MKSELYSFGVWSVPNRASSSDLQFGFQPSFVFICCRSSDMDDSLQMGFGTGTYNVKIDDGQFGWYRNGTGFFKYTYLDATEIRGTKETSSALSYIYLAFR